MSTCRLKKNILLIFIYLNLFFIFYTSSKAEELKNCKWDNKKGTPCITIRKTPNSSKLTEQAISKTIITKKQIINSGALDTNDVLKSIPGLDVFQSGPKGQQTSIFTRGSESNHTLVLLNGIAINDQSTTDGLHDFGQDYIQTFQQIEIYKGSNGSHFGPSAIAGAINLITDTDYTNSYSINGRDYKNNSIDGNYTKITNDGWHLNFKGSTTQSKTNSAIAKGTEKDGAKNYSINLNGKKWLNDNLKFTSTLYSRKTKADYDGDSSDEYGYISDNRMYALQTGLERISEDSKDNLILHYHNYDREYENSGFLDEYYSESFVLKGEREIIKSNKFSFGYGSEYKYDSGFFENRGSYTASTRGHMKNLGFFANAGYQLNKNQALSIFLRTDNHNTTDKNETYKINFNQIIDKFKFGATHSTGLRNPSLFELYGTDNYGVTGNTNLKPEKSKTNEIYIGYNFSNGFKFTSTAYRTTIFDRIESNSAYTTYENELIDLNQEGLENKLSFELIDHNFDIFTNFAKSRTTTGSHQKRRPDLSYGVNYKKNFQSNEFGPFNLNLNYKHTGEYLDYDGSTNSFQKSTDLIDLSLSKNLFGNIFSLNIDNLLNENYEKPPTYNQDGRKFRIGMRKAF